MTPGLEAVRPLCLLGVRQDGLQVEVVRIVLLSMGPINAPIIPSTPTPVRGKKFKTALDYFSWNFIYGSF